MALVLHEIKDSDFEYIVKVTEKQLMNYFEKEMLSF